MKRLKECNKTRSGAIPKKEFLQTWRDQEQRSFVNNPKPRPVDYNHKGTTIDQDGIRITGTLEFIEDVISNLKSLLQYENNETRLQISCSELKDKETGATIKNRYRCSIQVHERGNQAKVVGSIASAHGVNLY